MNFGPEKFGPTGPKFFETLLRILVQSTASKGGPGGLPPGLGHRRTRGGPGGLPPRFTRARRTRGVRGLAPRFGRLG